jgi:hypothetical protein
MKKTLLFLITLFTVVIGYSQTFVDNFVTYSITSTTNNTVQATDYDTAGGSVVNIPATVNYNSVMYTVTAIANNAFLNNQLTSITIPDGVITIGVNAFSTNFINNPVTIPNSVTTIGANAFLQNDLNSLVIGNSVISIGNTAFAFNNLSSVTIPDSVISIGDGAFGQNNNMTSVVIGSSVTSIGSYAFRYNALTSVTIPDSVTSLGSYAFSSNVISNLVIGNSLTSLTDHVFSYNNITSVSIPNSVTSIGAFAFYNNNLTNVVIPNVVTSIGDVAFAGNDLTDVIIGNNVTTIGNLAFNTNDLTSITIPASVTNIGESAFQNNALLTDVISLATTPPTITTGGSIDSFNSDRSNINLIIPNATTNIYVTNSGALWTGFKIVFEIITSTNNLVVTNYNSASGTNVTIPATITDVAETYTVTKIGDGAFFSKGLTSVSIPNGVTSIGTSAFNTNNLTSVTIPDSVITIGSQAFVTNDLTNLIIGNSVTNIEFGAFVDNNLTSITFPSSVTNIGSIAFAANPLTDVTSLATTPPTITTGTNDTFNISGDRSGINLHIPVGTTGVYVTNPGALWINFNSVTEDASLSTSNFELENGIKIVVTSEELKIISSGNAQLKNYSIYNISGAKVKNGKDNTIALNTLSNGIYILELTFNTGKLVKKFAK